MITFREDSLEGILKGKVQIKKYQTDTQRIYPYDTLRQRSEGDGSDIIGRG